MVASLDGVMAPIRGTGGYREAGHATASLVDGDAKRLRGVHMDRMPQAYKATLKMMVTAAVKAVLGCFRGNRHPMGHVDVKARDLTVGSGVVDAAWRTLVTERLGRSGMRWGVPSGQTILTPHPFVQNRRFDHEWSLLAKTYRTNMACPGGVVPLRRANVL